MILRHEDVSGLLTMDEAIQAVKEGLAEQAAGQVQLPLRQTIGSDAGYGWLRLMPGILNGSGFMGYKVMNRNPDVGVRYMVALYSLRTGDLLAHIDADYLTTQRTAAITAVATDALASDRVECVGILGSGEQARAQLAAVARVREFDQVKVFSPTPERRESFAEEMSGKLGVLVQAVGSAREAIIGTNLVIIAIKAGKSPVLPEEWVEAGMHINGISSVRPESREIEDGVWRKSDVVVVDDRSHVFESGDGRSALGSRSICADHTRELWEVVCEEALHRRNAQEVTLFKSVGTALQDLALAAVIYERAKELGLGLHVDGFPHIKAYF